jgi:parallel beta-helix repeat protein
MRKKRIIIDLVIVLIVVLVGTLFLWPEKFYLPLRRLVRPSKTITVPSDCKTIWKALAQAEYGDTIFIKAGIYDELFEFTGCVNIVGEGIDKTIIQSEYSQESVVKMYNCRGTKLSNLTLQHVGKKDTAAKTGVLFVQRGFMDIINCRIRRGDGYGMLIRKGSTVNIDNCVIEKNSMSGIIVWDKGTSVNVHNSTISSNGEYGILFEHGGGGSVENNTFKENESGSVKCVGTAIISKDNSFL